MSEHYGVRVAKSAGFCPGVRRAIDKALELDADGKKPVYTLGPLIHNKQVTDALASKNITSIDSLSEVKNKNATLVIRAHGITPQFRKELEQSGMELCDATCPLVKHAQDIIEKYASQGYDTVIIGDADHAEVIGLLGYADGRGHVAAAAQEADGLPPFKKVNIVAQTTQQESVFEQAAQIIAAKAETYVISNTICRPTRQRQSETMEFAKNADLVIVVGGKHSANTARLAKVCRELSPKTLLIEDERELSATDLKTPKNIFITAGASTPGWMIENVFEKVQLARRKFYYMPQIIIKRAWSFVLKSSFFTAAAALCLTYVAMNLQGIPVNPRLLFLALAFVFSLTGLNRVTAKTVSYVNTKLEVAFCLLLGAAGLFAAFTAGKGIFALTLFFWLLGVIYPFSYYLKIKKLTSIPGAKDTVTALGWAFVCAFVPAYAANIVFTNEYYLAVFYVTLLVFMRSILLGIGAANKDIMVSKESFYKAHGLRTTRFTVGLIWSAISAALIMLFIMGWNVRLVSMLLLGNIYTAFMAARCCRRPKPGSTLDETLIDGQFYILAALAFCSRFL
ncbi:MAG: 4-hydroxy-3-methylbut-2-enyl diphosphate reductase [Acidobacteriota bacterium]|jgi:4-hydroxy-3-methylbut-2-enyl diphosphate reductase|nr:4-hydroxy-3-methylbut-2-enyl diphosphate reductase [Acidobacteriota bacterium]